MATRNRDFEIDLKMRAEFGEAQRELVRTEKQVKSLARSLSQANRDLAGGTVGSKAVDRTTQSMDKATLSAKQLQQATRQLPVQFTDIFTGLATGQRPLQVFLQQGGQLKDVFGGIGPAARAAGGYLLGLINPLTLSAGAVAALAYAWNEGSKESQAFNEALIETGGIVGLTSDRLAEMSLTLSDGENSQRKVAATLAEITKSGKFTADQVAAITGAALDLQRIGGVAVEEVVERFAKLADEPVKAVLALNDATHFLTLEVYEQIKALEEQGRTQEAATLAMQTYADEVQRRTSQIEDNLGLLEKAWSHITLAADAAWDSMLGVGRAETGQEAFVGLQEQILAMEEALQTRASGGFSLSFLQLSDQELNSRIATMRDQMRALSDANVEEQKAANRRAEAQRAEEAAIALDQEAAKYASAEEKRAQRIAAARQQANDAVEAAMAADNKDLVAKIRADEAAIIAGIEAEAKKPRKRRPKKGEDPDAAAKSALANLQRQVALLGEVEDGETRVSEEARVRYEIQSGAYASANDALKAQLLENAKLLDAERARRDQAKEQKKAFEEAEKAYERMLDSLRTPAEVALDTAIERVQTLNEAMQRGIGDAGDYDEALERILKDSFKEAPKFQGLAPEVAGPFGELGKINEARTQLQEWYAERLQLLREARETEHFTNEQLNAAELQTEAEHQAKLRQLQSAQSQVMLAGASEMFDGLAGIARAYGGEQSKTYRALFALSKGFAVAQAAVALGQNVAEASKAGYPQNIPLIAAAFAQGAQIASLLAAATYGGGDGYATGGHVRGAGTGTSDSINARLSDYEYVTRAAVVRQPGALPFLEDFNERGMDALYGWTRFADGGLFESANEPRLPTPRYDTYAPTISPEMSVAVINALDLDDVAERLAGNRRFKKAVVNTVIEDQNTVRSGWEG
ncbi:phage tail length tape measure family protein [Marilutibacter aestuarii]|uniref:DNA-binding protein n=1 Tax=Marilutibacter aestuarii TaxID=1706195 RepID=A0A508ARZ3_9GAMM|nr:phage tail length tape measure family protein [Lysobacter aestuarii]TQD51241.1 DNA-binding protein [Lysobacter aestuarii]